VAEIRWTDQALSDLDAVAEFISRDSASISRIVVEQAFRAVERLADFPESGRVVPETNRPDVREIFVYAYRIIYRVKEPRVFILSVQHGAKLLKTLDIE
jgi:toxin ParE1/3/4